MAESNSSKGAPAVAIAVYALAAFGICAVLLISGVAGSSAEQVTTSSSVPPTTDSATSLPRTTVPLVTGRTSQPPRTTAPLVTGRTSEPPRTTAPDHRPAVPAHATPGYTG
jgi:hypothetical protein